MRVLKQDATIKSSGRTGITTQHRKGRTETDSIKEADAVSSSLFANAKRKMFEENTIN